MIYCLLNFEIDWVVFATFLTAVATFLTVREIKKQRQQSYMPNLVLLPDKRFYVYRFNQEEYFLNWYEKSLDNLANTEKRSSDFELDLYNIGLGSAKSVSFHYLIDEKIMRDFLTNLGASIETLELNKNILSFVGKYQGKDLCISTVKKDMDYMKVFIPKSDEEPFKIKIPQTYLYLFNAFLILTIDNPKRSSYFKSFPPLKLQIKYSDIANLSYKKKFKLGINIDSTSIHPNYPSYVSGVITVKEI